MSALHGYRNIPSERPALIPRDDYYDSVRGQEPPQPLAVELRHDLAYALRKRAEALDATRATRMLPVAEGNLHAARAWHQIVLGIRARMRMLDIVPEDGE